MKMLVQPLGVCFLMTKIAGNFTCGKDKTKYLVNFGIALWIKLLRDDVEIAVWVVIGFDESLNKATQTCQMDVNDEDYQPISERK